MKKLVILAILTIVSACTHIPSDINGDQVFFAFDSAKISDDARDNLESQALYMKKNPDVNVTLQGRCDERGSTEYNLALGALRAGNAAHVMIHDGIEPERIKTISYGKENPIYPGTGEEVWAKNRNATTVVQKQQ
jgi:peptidoglycan-associated lipoprotein